MRISDWSSDVCSSDLRPVSRSKSYTDFLPNVSARLRLTPKLQLRLAFTETRTRPGFGDLNPSLTIGAPATICTPSPDDPEAGPDNPNCVRTSNGGNADLEPIKSQKDRKSTRLNSSH